MGRGFRAGKVYIQGRVRGPENQNQGKHQDVGNQLQKADEEGYQKRYERSTARAIITRPRTPQNPLSRGFRRSVASVLGERPGAPFRRG